MCCIYRRACRPNQVPFSSLSLAVSFQISIYNLFCLLNNVDFEAWKHLVKYLSYNCYFPNIGWLSHIGLLILLWVEMSAHHERKIKVHVRGVSKRWTRVLGGKGRRQTAVGASSWKKPPTRCNVYSAKAEVDKMCLPSL